ncbi:pseudouridine synthase, partial [Lentithecium fluviatile CBS 122367]
MATPPKESQRVIEGIFAINKPQWASSAGVLRDLQTYFSASPLFAPWLTHTRRNLILSHAKQRLIKNLNVKLGHGGTLDPLATGVLIVGVGKGTKCLQRFLECTKTYECVVLFGAATDSYDAVGKIVSRASYAHVTKELVERKLEAFRGEIMQKPSVFSALKVDGKKMYEYARAGGDIPEVPARPVEVHELELVDWLEPGTHEYAWPKEEMDSTEQAGAERLLGIRKADADVAARRNRKRSRSPDDSWHAKKLKMEDGSAAPDAPPTEEAAEPAVDPEDHVTDAESHPKEPTTADEPAMSGALPTEITTDAEPTQPVEPPKNDLEPLPQPPAARIRLTVTSGFYVRSFCHDLGIACDSLGLMSSLVRSRQGDYELGKNVLEYTDLEAGQETWEPKLQKLLEDFMEQEGWKPEEVDDDETWEARKKDIEKERKENNRDRSYQGGRKGGNGKGWYKKR